MTSRLTRYTPFPYTTLFRSWSTDELPWETNGTAVVWRRDRFEQVEVGACALSDDGNVATTLTARVTSTDRVVRASSVQDRKSTRLNSSHSSISYAVF